MFVLFAAIVLFVVGACLVCPSCQMSSKESAAVYNTELVEQKKKTLPIDEHTYFFSRSIYYFEEEGKELLYFENTKKGQYEIIIYDIDAEVIAKRIGMHKQGADGVPSVMGSRPLGSSSTFVLFQNNMSQITLLDDEGKVLRKYPIKSPETPFIPFLPSSDFYTLGFMKDSVLYVAPLVAKPNMTKEDWRTTSLLFGLDLRTGDVDFVPLYYPSVFNHDVKNIAMGAEFSYDFNDCKNRLVCSFINYDSLMVCDDLCSVKWYDGKSRYLKEKRPKLIEASGGIQAIAEAKEEGFYYHVMYDKYRDVYYRFVEHPCELGENEGYMDDPKAREFSVIIFDKDFRIIGETKFPGNKYFIRMSFVGRDGLYISENNLANPDFDEDKLVFACFKLEEIKE